MFSICQGKGFQITFDNGYTVSVQFGPGNHCNNKWGPFTGPAAPDKQWAYSCADAEVAIIRPDNSFVRITEWDSVIGGQSPADVAKWITIASTNPEQAAHPEPSAE